MKKPKAPAEKPVARPIEFRSAAIPRTWRPHVPALLLLWTFILLAYSNSFRAGFVFDNRLAVMQDSRVHAATADNVRAIVGGDYWYRSASTGLYRPLTKLSYLVNYAVLGGGPNPSGYHWFNLVVHAVNAGLVYLLGLVLFRVATHRRAMAFAFALVWALHPVLTESVTNIVGRADMLAATGVVGGLLCHIQARTAYGRRRAAWLAALAIVGAAGISSKENGVVLVAVLLLYDIAFEGAGTWRAGLPSYFAAVLPAVAYLFVRHQVLGGLPEAVAGFFDNPLFAVGFWTGRVTAIQILGQYIWLLIWPAQLSCDYSYNQVPAFAWRLTSAQDFQAAAAVGMCLAAGVLALACYRRHKAVFFFIALSFVCIAPMANIALLIDTIMAERFLYLPAIGFAGCVVLGVCAVGGRLCPIPYAAPVLLGILCTFYAARTFARNFDWTDDVSLWSSAVRASPQSYKTHMARAQALAAGKAADPEDALREADRALAILDPLSDEKNSAPAYATAGLWYRQRGDQAGPGGNSAAWYQKALQILQRGQRIDLATTRETARRNSEHGKTLSLLGHAPLYLELGRTYLRLADPRPAAEVLEYGRRIEPDPEFSDELAKAYRAMGNPQRAAVALMEGLLLNPSEVAFAAQLVDLYKETEPASCAVTTSQGAATINLGCALVHDHLCTAAEGVFRLQAETLRLADSARTAQSATHELGCPAERFR